MGGAQHALGRLPADALVGDRYAVAQSRRAVFSQLLIALLVSVGAGSGLPAIPDGSGPSAFGNTPSLVNGYSVDAWRTAIAHHALIGCRHILTAYHCLHRYQSPVPGLLARAVSV